MSVELGYPDENMYVYKFGSWEGLRVEVKHKLHVYYGNRVKRALVGMLFMCRHFMDKVRCNPSQIDTEITNLQDRITIKYSEDIPIGLSVHYSIRPQNGSHTIYISEEDGKAHVEYRNDVSSHLKEVDNTKGNSVINASIFLEEQFLLTDFAPNGARIISIMELLTKYREASKEERLGDNYPLFKVVNILERATELDLSITNAYNDLVYVCSKDNQLDRFAALASCIICELLSIEQGFYVTLGVENIDFGDTKLQRLALDLVCLLVNSGGYVHMATNSEYVLSLLNVYIRSSSVEIEQSGIYRSIVEPYKRIRVEDISAENLAWFNYMLGYKPGFFVNGVFTISDDFKWLQNVPKDLDRIEEFNRRYKL